MKLQDQGFIVSFAVASLVCQQPSRERFEALAATDLWACFESPDDIDPRLFETWATLRTAVACALKKGDSYLESLAAEYTKLFRGLVPGKWARPAYETVFRTQSEEEGRQCLREINALYRRSGISLSVADRVDFIAIEFDVMREMLVRGAQGITEAYEAAADLLQKHIALWVPAQAAEVGAATQQPFFQSASRYLEAIAAV